LNAKPAPNAVTKKIKIMGGGNKRKDNDVLRVNLPKKSTGSGGGGTNGGGAGGSTTPIDINQMCPQAFDVGIKSKRPLPDRTPITIKGDELFVINENVGKLPAKYLKIITECGGEGIRYSGRVLNKGEKAYARFEQNIGR
jgi:hypothetical protein